MSGPVRILILPMIVLLATGAACDLQRAAANGGPASSREGVTVTKEVPSSKETVGEIQERESKEPPPKREDRVIPFHRIPRDNNSIPATESAPDNTIR